MEHFRELGRLFIERLSSGTCPRTGKRTFVSAAAAQEALELAQLRAAAGQERRHEAGAYRCPNCPGWHLTSRPWTSATG